MIINVLQYLLVYCIMHDLKTKQQHPVDEVNTKLILLRSYQLIPQKTRLPKIKQSKRKWKEGWSNFTCLSYPTLVVVDNHFTVLTSTREKVQKSFTNF